MHSEQPTESRGGSRPVYVNWSGIQSDSRLHGDNFPVMKYYDLYSKTACHRVLFWWFSLYIVRPTLDLPRTEMYLNNMSFNTDTKNKYHRTIQNSLNFHWHSWQFKKCNFLEEIMKFFTLQSILPFLGILNLYDIGIYYILLGGHEKIKIFQGTR